MDIINTLYKEYIHDSRYVYYKEKNTIIIMEKLGDLECVLDTELIRYNQKMEEIYCRYNGKFIKGTVSDIYPKKLFSETLSIWITASASSIEVAVYGTIKSSA